MYKGKNPAPPCEHQNRRQMHGNPSKERAS